MFSRAISGGRLDRLAIALSGLCIAHCLATAVFVAFLSTAGGFLVHPLVHEIGLVVAMLLGAVALIQGVRQHGYYLPIGVGSLGLGIMGGALTMPHDGKEAVFTIIGVLIVAFGHDLNRRAVI